MNKKIIISIVVIIVIIALVVGITLIHQKSNNNINNQNDQISDDSLYSVNDTAINSTDDSVPVSSSSDIEAP